MEEQTGTDLSLICHGQWVPEFCTLLNMILHEALLTKKNDKELSCIMLESSLKYATSIFDLKKLMKENIQG